MGKADFLTAKAIGNRMKAKGLQKLRWFCQVCQKQCRDENGFKCHTTSESHQRQMLIVANNPDKFLSQYSDEFERAFLENLRRRHGTKRMAANVVYNEYISDKLHVHMNATQWTTLGSFVQYLGRTGKCIVDETEKGWFIQYIDRDPRTLARQQELEKKKKADLDHEERNRLFIERQLNLAREARKTELSADGTDTSESDELRPTKMFRREGDEKISISLSATTKDAQSHKSLSLALPNVFGGEDMTSETGDSSTRSGGRQIDAMKQEFEELEARKHQHKRRREEKVVRQDNWIAKGIIVKVLNKKVANGKYYKLKGEVVGVKDRFGATVEMLDSGDVLQLDQDDLETVIPKVGRRVMVVNGIGRGSVAKLLSIDVDKFCASVRLETGIRKGEELDGIEYEDICRLADESTNGK